MKNGELFNQNIIIGIDPGPTTSGQVVVDASIFPPVILQANSAASQDELVNVYYDAKTVICEWIVSYSSAIGSSVLDTARLVGRIEERSGEKGMKFHKLTRPEVGLELAGQRRAKKAQVNEAVRELYRKNWSKLGGGKNPVVGTKKNPGPLYHVKSHAWDALAVIIAWLISR